MVAMANKEMSFFNKNVFKNLNESMKSDLIGTSSIFHHNNLRTNFFTGRDNLKNQDSHSKQYNSQLESLQADNDLLEFVK